MSKLKKIIFITISIVIICLLLLNKLQDENGTVLFSGVQNNTLVISPQAEVDIIHIDEIKPK